MNTQWLDLLDSALQREVLLEVIALSAAVDDLSQVSTAAAAVAAR